MKRRTMKRQKAEMNPPQNVEIAIAWLRRDQYELLRALSADGESLEQTYDEWEMEVLKRKHDFESNGFVVHRIEVELNALVSWCKSEGRALDGKARAEYAARRLGREL